MKSLYLLHLIHKLTRIFLIQNPENKLLTIFKFADKKQLREIEFKSKMERLIQNPEALSYTP